MSDIPYPLGTGEARRFAPELFDLPPARTFTRAELPRITQVASPSSIINPRPTNVAPITPGASTQLPTSVIGSQPRVAQVPNAPRPMSLPRGAGLPANLGQPVQFGDDAAGAAATAAGGGGGRNIFSRAASRTGRFFTGFGGGPATRVPGGSLGRLGMAGLALPAAGFTSGVVGGDFTNPVRSAAGGGTFAATAAGMLGASLPATGVIGATVAASDPIARALGHLTGNTIGNTRGWGVAFGESDSPGFPEGAGNVLADSIDQYGLTDSERRDIYNAVNQFAQQTGFADEVVQDPNTGQFKPVEGASHNGGAAIEYGLMIAEQTAAQKKAQEDRLRTQAWMQNLIQRVGGRQVDMAEQRLNEARETAAMLPPHLATTHLAHAQQNYQNTVKMIDAYAMQAALAPQWEGLVAAAQREQSINRQAQQMIDTQIATERAGLGTGGDDLTQVLAQTQNGGGGGGGQPSFLTRNVPVPAGV